VPTTRLPSGFAVAALVLVALVGCTPASPSPAPSAPTESILSPELQPVLLDAITEETAAAEALRLADAMQGSIAASSIADVQDEQSLIAADDDIAAYYAFHRTIALTPETDALTIAELLVAVLDQSGWDIFEATTEGGVYVAALSGDAEEASWFALVGADASVEGESTVTFQLASPDIR